MAKLNNRKVIVAGNWKLHKTPAEARAFVREWKEHGAPILNDVEESQRPMILIFPPAFVLGTLLEEVKSLTGATSFKVGPQNVFYENQGAYTGENSPSLAREMGAQYALAGHSERRQLFGETDEMISKKVLAASECGLIPMLCVGETLEERGSGRTQAVIARQLEQGLSLLPDGREFVIAYEPVWAIGTGKVATKEQAQEAHAFLRGELRRLRGDTGGSATILYGGSVKPDNAQELFKQPDVDGFLVGGASLKAADFCAIVESVLKSAQFV